METVMFIYCFLHLRDIPIPSQTIYHHGSVVCTVSYPQNILNIAGIGETSSVQNV